LEETLADSLGGAVVSGSGLTDREERELVAELDS
jgi:hypothetical protein